MKKKTVVKKQKSTQTKARSVESLVKQVLEEVAHNRKHLEEKIEYSRVDAREQLQSFRKGVNQQMRKLQQGQDSSGKRMDGLEGEMQTTQMALRATKDEVIATRKELKHEIRAIGTRIEDHDERIASLESTA